MDMYQTEILVCYRYIPVMLAFLPYPAGTNQVR